jgi:hypothetical protein
MKYDLKTPCAHCPFRSDVKPYIHPERVEEIIGQPFSCHKTTTCKDRGNDHPEAQHCAGSLILHEKMEKPHQMMRIMERLGGYDRTKLNMDAPVYDDANAMISAHEDYEHYRA